MKNKMIRNIVIMAAVLVAVVGLLILTPKLQPKVDEPDVTAEPESLYIVNHYYEDVVEYKIIREDETVNVVYDADINKYFFKGDDETELDQSKARGTASILVNILADSIIEDNLDNLAVFGLDDPIVTTITTLANGEIIVAYVGDLAPSQDAYYMYVEGDDRIITIKQSFYTYASYTNDQLHLIENTEYAYDQVVAVSINQKGEEELSFISVDIKDSRSMSIFQMTSPWVASCDAEELAKLQENVTGIKIDNIIETKPEDLSIYGLDDPYATISYELGNGAVKTFIIGNMLDNYSYYAQIDDSPIIYDISSSFIDKVLASEPLPLVDKLYAIYSIYITDAVNFNGFGIDNTLNIQHYLKKNTDGSNKLDGNGNPLSGQKFYLDKSDEEYLEDAGRKLYQELISLYIHSPIVEGKEISSKSSAVLTFEFSDGESIVINFYEYNLDYYAVELNGRVDFAVLQTTVQDMASMFEKALDGSLEEEILAKDE